MHADYLNVTVPHTHGDTVRSHFLDLMAECRSQFRPGPPKIELWSSGSSGTFKLTDKGEYAIYSASGDALASLRENKVFDDYLWMFGEVPHRVTKIDIAHDVEQDPTEALRRLTRKAYSETGIRITRKKIKREHVTPIARQDKFGRTTGSLYLGRRTSEAYAIVYDKRAERWDRAGTELGRDLVRYELTVTSKLGVTLKDAYNPEPVFWHFMGGVLSQPHSVSDWVPGDTGFSLPPRVTLLPSEALRRRVEASPEIAELARLASAVGPSGLDYALSLISRRLRSEVPQSPVDDSAASEGTS